MDIAKLTLGIQNFVHHGRSGGYQIEVVLTLKALLHDFHMQHTEKTTAKTKTQCRR